MRYGIAVILIIIFAIIGSIVLFSGGNSSSKSSTMTSRITKLADYADNSQSRISWTIQGRVVGDDQFKSIRITVTPQTRTVEVLDGYEERVEKKAEFTNSAAAYQTFMRALDLANFGRERTVKRADDRGVCPLGNRYIYRLEDGSKEVMRTWSDNCLIADGPFAGSASLIGQLFKGQITDYSQFTNSVRI